MSFLGNLVALEGCEGGPKWGHPSVLAPAGVPDLCLVCARVRSLPGDVRCVVWARVVPLCRPGRESSAVDRVAVFCARETDLLSLGSAAPPSNPVGKLFTAMAGAPGLTAAPFHADPPWGSPAVPPLQFFLSA